MTKVDWFELRHLAPHPVHVNGTRNICNNCRKPVRTVRWRFSGRFSYVWLCPPCVRIVEKRTWTGLGYIMAAALVLCAVIGWLKL